MNLSNSYSIKNSKLTVILDKINAKDIKKQEEYKKQLRYKQAQIKAKLKMLERNSMPQGEKSKNISSVKSELELIETKIRNLG